LQVLPPLNVLIRPLLSPELLLLQCQILPSKLASSQLKSLGSFINLQVSNPLILRPSNPLKLPYSPASNFLDSSTLVSYILVSYILNLIASCILNSLLLDSNYLIFQAASFLANLLASNLKLSLPVL
jgi:hypothetical protein